MKTQREICGSVHLEEAFASTIIRIDNFTTHTRNKDLPWNTVFSIREDNAGNLWLGTENGLSCYLTRRKKFITYDMKDGLQGRLFAAGFGW